MATATIAGQAFEFEVDTVERAAAALVPEPIRDHYLIVNSRRYPPKQVLAALTGLDRADFTTHQARAIFRRLGFGVYRRGQAVAPQTSIKGSPKGGAERALLTPFMGRWVAQDDLEILFDGDSPEEVIAWLRRHGCRATVWRVPVSPREMGSAMVSPW